MCNFKVFFKKFFSSPLLEGQSNGRKAAYLGFLTAFVVVANAFFTVKLTFLEFNFMIAVCALVGALVGCGYGFAVCFLGDLIGFMINPGGAYMPWIGISNGLTALFSGALLTVGKSQKGWGRYLRTAIFCLLSFFVCSVGITNTAFYFTYHIKDFANVSWATYWAYFSTRYLIGGQIYNSLINYAVVFALPFLLGKLPFLKNTK